jgi:tetratricopeptide (TPR) repeat protein
MSGRCARVPSTALRHAALHLVACLALALGGGVAIAQRGVLESDPALTDTALGAFNLAVTAADEAVASPLPWSPDAPAWRRALASTRAAVQVAPDHPAVLRLQFRTFAIVGWWVRAADTASAYLEAALSLDPPMEDPWADGDEPVPDGPPTRELLGRVFAELGFARYQLGTLEAARLVYERWLELAPDEVEALRWIGRIWLEMGEPEAALPYWSRLGELLPDDDAAAFFRSEAELGIQVGSVAAAAFREGVARYEAGDLAAAMERFDAATAAAPDFVSAYAWAGRAALEAGRPGDALARYGAAAALRPGDAALDYFVRLSRTQVDFGVRAGRAYFAGLTAYERGDLDGAAERFEATVEANAAFGEAWAWLGRVRQEQGRYAEAETAWAEVVALDPRDERARGFLNLAREQRAYASDAGDPDAAADFAAGVAAFERADFEEAAARFGEVVAADPGSGLGWTWLGRVAYTVRDFATAANAFERARELLPNDEDVAWFADDAVNRLREQQVEEAGQ